MSVLGHFFDVEYAHLAEQSSAQFLDYLLFFPHYPGSSYKVPIPIRFVIVLKEKVFLSLMHVSRKIKILEFSPKSSGIKSISFFFNYTKACLLICSQNGLSAGKLP